MAETTTTNSRDTIDDRPEGRRRGRGGAIAAGVLLVLLLLAGGAYVAGYVMAGEKTPKNASVNGVSIGGLTNAEAVTKLRTELGPDYTKPVTISGGGKTATIKPDQAGMAVDWEKTVRAAGAGKSWSPTHIWNVLSGGGALKPVVSVDESKVAEGVRSVAPTFSIPAKDATIALKDGKVVTTPAQQAQALDEAKTVKAVRDAWPDSQQVEAPLTHTDPAVTDAAVEKVKTEQLDPALSGPLTVKAGQKSFQIQPSEIAAATTVTTKGGEVTASTDVNKLWTVAQQRIDELNINSGKDASFTIQGGKPVVVPSQDGMGITQENFVKAVEPAIHKTGGERTVSVPVTKTPAKFSTADANKLGIKQVTGEFTTYFPHADYRNTNLSQFARKINGHVLKPGETFSVNDTVGERTPANGFIDGYVIQGDRLVKESGGGVSQGATTTFNAAFFAGLQDVEHHPHTLYFPRYPAGREATLYYGHLDLKFKNDTDYGVMIQAIVSKSSPGNQGSITVRMWSTKTWDEVRSTELKKSNFTSAEPVTSDSPTCEPQAASEGFTVNYQRQFIKGGKVVKSEPFRWTYEATPEVSCR